MSKEINLCDAELAIPIYQFVVGYKEDYLLKREEEDLSMAEYVSIYRKSEFRDYLVEIGYLNS